MTTLFGLPAAWAQEDNVSRVTESMLEEIIVTSRKREESSQDVPLSVTAYSFEQLEALKIRDLSNLSVKMPNVAMDDVGTARGVANFSIRGLGINSSIPSIDPTVGVFIDGVYIGQNAGVVIDMFDIASIEVLRGPQGILFGRNVTGGAVLVNSKRPTQELEFTARVAVDGNPNGDGGLSKYIMGAVSGPLGDQAGFRVSVYHNKDDGWFTNLFNNEDFGKTKTTIFRPVLSFNPTENVQVLLRWEHTDSKGQGPASQNHTNGFGISAVFANYDRDSFDFSIDEEGLSDFETDLVTMEVNWDVDFGDGTITNILGWRDYSSMTIGDIDATPRWIFHAPAWNYSEQWSNELRYNGTFGAANVTTGLYWFDNEINYHERRNLLGIATGNVRPALTQDGGGDYWVDSLAAFAAMDYNLTEEWVLTAGIRYTAEDKKADIASLVVNTNRPCNVTEGTCPFDFRDSDSWNAFSGKLGATYLLSGDQRIYGHWSRSQRSGGYNLRNTSPTSAPGPFDEETVDNFEIGYKSELANRGRFNAAVFYNQIGDMQREINLADPISGVVQIIKNTADAEIWGLELDGAFPLGESTVLLASLGYIDPKYTKIFFDLNGDGVINDADKDLSLPRAAEWTYSIGLVNDIQIGEAGYLTSRINYAYRDDAFYTDNNRGFLLSQDVLDAGLDFATSSGHWVFSIYGRNLLNSVNHGGDTQLPTLLGPIPLGGTFSPLAKGRVAGVEVTFAY